jgi:hypothetical protein
MVMIPGPFGWANALKLSPMPFASVQLDRLRASVPGLDQMGIALIDVSKGLPVGYGLNFRKTGFAASLPKIAAMYAAFHLQDRLKASAVPLIGMSLREIEATLRKEWRAELKAKVPRSAGDFPDITSIFKSAPGFGFSDKFQKDLELMMKESDNAAAGRCIHRIGYDYLNGSLIHAGLFSVADSSGLWLAGDYIPATSASNRDGPRAPGLKTGQAASAEAVALLLSNLSRNELISAKASQDMKNIMSNAYSWVRYEMEDVHPGAVVHGKLGLMNGRQGSTHDCAVVKHATAHYVVVALFGQLTDLQPLFLELDAIAQQLFVVRKAALLLRSVVHA